MKIVIDIDEKDYKRIKEIPETFDSLTSRAYKVIKDGTPLPKGHGRLIDADAIPRHLVRDIDEIDKQPTIIEGSDSECQE
jgi:hypothetical protein